VHKKFVRNPEAKRQFGRMGHRRVGNIKMDLKEMGSEDVDWIYLAHYRGQW